MIHKNEKIKYTSLQEIFESENLSEALAKAHRRIESLLERERSLELQLEMLKGRDKHEE